jgi:hypothetical protein
MPAFETVLEVLVEFIKLIFEALFNLIFEVLLKGTWEVIVRIYKYIKTKIILLTKHQK